MLTREHSIAQALEHLCHRIRFQEPLAFHTTLGVGGPANVLIEASTVEQIRQAVAVCEAASVPYFLLGGGSNVIFADAGFRGVVIRNLADAFEILDELPQMPPPAASGHDTRFSPPPLDVALPCPEDDADAPAVLVRVASGARLMPLMKHLFQKGITGLEWFAGIPATVGGAVFMNLHGGPQFFGDLVHRALLYRHGRFKFVDREYFRFGYDWSVLHDTREIVLEVDLRLRRGDVARARRFVKAWAAYKSNQPQRSAGCIFQNLSPEQQRRLDLPTTSVGYVIDQVLGLKGRQIGGARIAPTHAAFIENLGQATAADVLALIETVQQAARERLGIELPLEVELVGFEGK
ncbi:MAG: hypothetical protein Q9P14_17025 [candidate division KSB1 bacterium]|nr:hypothetical protein [candidate division KSB1 bacterium]